MGGSMFFIPVLLSLFYLAILFVVAYFVYTWVSIFISLKREHNDLLREILKKMDKDKV
jgi:hypothetical protein